MTRIFAALALTVAAIAVAAPASAAGHRPDRGGAGERGCAPTRAGLGFYEAGSVATVELTTPASRCRTISVSHVVDRDNPADRCQVFLVGMRRSTDDGYTYSDEKTVCGRQRTTLARHVPDGTLFIVIYRVDYIEPDVQIVRFKIWR